MRKELDEIIERYNLIEETYKGFWKAYDNYLIDEITREKSKELGLKDRDSVYVELDGYSYFVSKRFEIDVIEVILYIYYSCDDEYWGKYISQFTVDGKDCDDYFVIE